MKTICIILAFVILSLGCITLFKRVADLENHSTLESESAVETIDSGFSFVKRFSKDDFIELNGSKYVSFGRSVVVPQDRLIRVVAKLNGDVNFRATGVSFDSDFVLPESETKTLSGVWKLNDELVYTSILDQQIDFRFVGFASTVSCSWMSVNMIPLYGTCSLEYYFDSVPTGFKYETEYDSVYDQNGWVTYDRYTPNLIDFGSEPQEVSVEFYEWFVANASACMTSQFAEFTLNGTGEEEVYYLLVPSSKYSNVLYLDDIILDGTGEVDWIEVHVEYEPSDSEEVSYELMPLSTIPTGSYATNYTVAWEKSVPSDWIDFIADGGRFMISGASPNLAYASESQLSYVYLLCDVNGSTRTIASLEFEGYTQKHLKSDFEFHPGPNDVISNVRVEVKGFTVPSVYLYIPT